MDMYRKLFIAFLILTFILGLYVIVYHDAPSCSAKKRQGKQEGLETQTTGSESCPNLLVQRGNVLMLYNTDLPTVEGSNPMPFFNLDEYIHYVDLQKERGIDCPVLFIQQENNAQGEDVYRVRPGPFDPQGGLPTETNVSTEVMDKITNAIEHADASRDNPPYNQNNYPGIDPQGLHIGQYTDLDAIHDSTSSKTISDNPMDANWAGVIYTQQMIDSGKYAENEISKPTLFNPKTQFLPSIPTHIPPPKDII